MKILLALIVGIAFLLAIRYALRAKAPAQSGKPPRPALMDRAEACEVLGVSTMASEEEVIEAHRRLMQKVHPDKGGSAFLARQLNEAKRVLLQNS